MSRNSSMYYGSVYSSLEGISILFLRSMCYTIYELYDQVYVSQEYYIA